MLEDHFLEDSLDPLLESQLQHIKLWKASKDLEYRHFLDGLLESLKKKIHCFEVQTCILITLPSRFFVCEVETVTAYSSQLRIAAGEGRKLQSEATRKAERERERTKGEKREEVGDREKKITQEGVWMRQWRRQGVKRCKHHQCDPAVTRFGSGLNTTLGQSI